MGEGDYSLASKCLAFCQTLTSQGMAFNFSLAIGASFCFSLDTRDKAPSSQGTKKKASPSTLRRNARRREEFLKRKHCAPEQECEESQAEPGAPSCDQCDYIAASEKGLRQHIRMKHGKLQLVTLQQSSLASPESLRETVSYSEALMNSSPKSPIAESCSKRQSKQETKCDICKIDLNTHEEFKNHNRMIHKLPDFPF